MRHVVESQQFDRSLLEQVFSASDRMLEIAGSGGSNNSRLRLPGVRHTADLYMGYIFMPFCDHIVRRYTVRPGTELCRHQLV